MIKRERSGNVRGSCVKGRGGNAWLHRGWRQGEVMVSGAKVMMTYRGGSKWLEEGKDATVSEGRYGR